MVRCLVTATKLVSRGCRLLVRGEQVAAAVWLNGVSGCVLLA